MDIEEKFDKFISKFGIIPPVDTVKMIVVSDNPRHTVLADNNPDNKDMIDASIDNSSLIREKRINMQTAIWDIQQNNLSKIARDARAHLSEENETASDKEVSMDWMLRFMNLAGNICDEQLQDVWSKVLATEVAQPGHASLHSLFVLANMSRREADLFTRISNYVLSVNGDHVLLNDDDFNSKQGIRYVDFLRLGEYGLVENSGVLSLMVPLHPNEPAYISYGAKVLEIYGKSEEKMAISVFVLTEAGETLWSMIDKKNYTHLLDDVQTFLYKNHKGLTINEVKK